MTTATALGTDLACALDAARFMHACGLPPDPWQAQVVRSAAPRRLLLACRQSGKSSTVACLALHRALFWPGSLVLLLSPSLAQTQHFNHEPQTAWNSLSHNGL